MFTTCAGLFCLFISVLLLEIQLSEVEGWDVINQFNSATFIFVLLLRDPVIRGRGLGCY